jgi:hypothetical protein
MECRLAGETEVLGENLSQRHFCPSQNLTWADSGLNPGRRGGKPATNRLSYGAASLCCYFVKVKLCLCLYVTSWRGVEIELYLLRASELDLSCWTSLRWGCLTRIGQQSNLTPWSVSM